MQKRGKVKEKIIYCCKEFGPIFFRLGDIDSFNTKIYYISVDSKGLLELDSCLEGGLEDIVDFREKLDEEKTLHVTINSDKTQYSLPKSMYALRLTVLRKLKIWFSYDFFKKQALNRKETLDKELWAATKEEFQLS